MVICTFCCIACFISIFFYKMMPFRIQLRYVLWFILFSTKVDIYSKSFFQLFKWFLLIFSTFNYLFQSLQGIETLSLGSFKTGAILLVSIRKQSVISLALTIISLIEILFWLMWIKQIPHLFFFEVSSNFEVFYFSEFRDDYFANLMWYD